MLTETWLANKHCPPMNDLTAGASLNFIRRDRGSCGGGVAVCYNPNKIRMSRFKSQVVDNNTEIICAVGSCQLTQRKICAISIYLPPSMSAAQLAQAVQTLTDYTDEVLIKYHDVIVMIGGDFNGKDISSFLSAHSSLKATCAGATRQGVALDEIYSNVQERIVEKGIQKPLSKEDGTESDHYVISASIKLPRGKKSIAKSFTFRPITKEGVEKFGALLIPFDWSRVLVGTASEDAVTLDTI